MAKVTITIEDTDDTIRMRASFEPKPKDLNDWDSLTSAQQAACVAMGSVTGESEEITDVKVNRS